jgi:hypothetical protein
MASTGQKYPGAGVAFDWTPYNNVGWNNPGNLCANDNAWVQSAGPLYYAYSKVLRGYSFDFSSVPDGATINGVTVRVNCWQTISGAPLYLNLVQLFDTSGYPTGSVKGGNTVANWETTYTYGSSSDKWGCSLTSSWVKNSNFGVGLGFYCWGEYDPYVLVDCVTIEIDYTPAAGGPPLSCSRMGAFGRFIR